MASKRFREIISRQVSREKLRFLELLRPRRLASTPILQGDSV
jgi:hypothetical protein